MHSAPASIDPDNYIEIGDHVHAVNVSGPGPSFQGHVVGIEGTERGRRSYLVETTQDTDRVPAKVRLCENQFVFGVERGDAWVLVPQYLLVEKAQEKAKRALLNTERRLRAKMPLFADQISVPMQVPEEMVLRVATERTATLLREHSLAVRSTSIRSKVQSQVTAEEFAALIKMRAAYPRTALYGIGFWQKQLEHVHTTGRPALQTQESTLPQALNRPEWLVFDAEVLWRSPSGPRRVRVLYVGRTTIMVKIIGRPMIDYDPKEFPYGNLWTDLEQLEPCTSGSNQTSILRSPPLPETELKPPKGG